MTTLTAHRYRLVPTPEQVSVLSGFVGCRRWFWNMALTERDRSYRETGKSTSWAQIDQLRRKWRADHPWFKAFPAQAAQQVTNDLKKAYADFFEKKRGRPKLKRKGKSRDSCRFPQQWTWDKPRKGETKEQVKAEGRGRWQIRLERLSRKVARLKLPKVGWIRLRYHRTLVGEVRNVTVSREAGRWYVSILQRCDGDHPTPLEPEDIAPDRSVGLDLGVAQSVTTSDGEIFQVPTMSPGDERHLKRLQRRLSRRQGPRKGVAPSGRWRAARAALQRFHAKVKRRRLDAIHKFTHLLTSSSLYDQITMEDLNTSGMTRKVRGKGRAAKASLNRSILAQSWGEIGRQLEYKCERTGIRFAKINPAYTSQKCSACGHVEKANRQTQADFCCVRCGHSDNADLNAAKNINAAGQVASVRGGDIRPQVIAETPSLVAAPTKREWTVRQIPLW